jgi:hypothetical protein
MDEIDISFVGQIVTPIAVASAFEPTPSGLAAAPNIGGGTFAAGTYFWVITGTDALGETTASNEATAVVALNGTVTLTWNQLPQGTTGVKVYRGTVSGSENALIATLGPVVTFNDTGTAGSAATPPIVNSAEIGTQLIVSGPCRLWGFGIRETSGINPVSLGIRNGGQEVVPLVIGTGLSSLFYFGEPGIHFRNNLQIRVNSGVFSGSIYVQYME